MIPHGNRQCGTRLCVADDKHLVSSLHVSGRCHLLRKVIFLTDYKLLCDENAIYASLKYQFFTAADESVMFRGWDLGII